MASAMIKVLCGCLTWKLIWCGENLILFPLQTFNSTVKKWPLAITNPIDREYQVSYYFPSLFHENILGINFS